MNQTLQILRQRFWWPRMVQDDRKFVAACIICSRGKCTLRCPMGLLQPLPIPSHPWSQLSIDLVSGLSPSNGNTVIFTVVDRFSKMFHFIPLHRLPSARDCQYPYELRLQTSFQLTLFLTLVSSSHPRYGKFCVKLWGHPLAWLSPPDQWTVRESQSGSGVSS